MPAPESIHLREDVPAPSSYSRVRWLLPRCGQKNTKCVSNFTVQGEFCNKHLQTPCAPQPLGSMTHKGELVEGKFAKSLANKFWESIPPYKRLITNQGFPKWPDMNNFTSAPGSCLLPATSRLLSRPPLLLLERGKHIQRFKRKCVKHWIIAKHSKTRWWHIDEKHPFIVFGPIGIVSVPSQGGLRTGFGFHSIMAPGDYLFKGIKGIIIAMYFVKQEKDLNSFLSGYIFSSQKSPLKFFSKKGIPLG